MGLYSHTYSCGTSRSRTMNRKIEVECVRAWELPLYDVRVVRFDGRHRSSSLSCQYPFLIYICCSLFHSFNTAIPILRHFIFLLPFYIIYLFYLQLHAYFSLLSVSISLSLSRTHFSLFDFPFRKEMP